MRSLFLSALSVVLFLGCQSCALLRPGYILELPGDVSELPGAYYQGGDGLYRVLLDLKQDQTYSATWIGCLGIYGTSFGSWSFQDGRILIQPTKETGILVGHLVELVVGHQDEAIFLVADLENDFFKKYGPNRKSVFIRSNEFASE